MKKQFALLSVMSFTFVLLALLGISLTAQAAPSAAVPQAPAAPIRILVNEFYRDSNLGTGNEWIEVLLVEDLTAAQLQGFYIGDSTSSTAAKFSGYRITDTASIAAVFPKGTLIVLGGSAAFSEDTSYNPGSGDWNILLSTSGSHISSNGSTGDLAGTDVVYVDTDGTNGSTTISTDGFAVNWDSSPGALGANSNVTVSVPANGTGVVLTSTLAGATTASNWATSVVSTTLTPGQPNGGDNTTYINSLRTPSVSSADLDLAKSGPATASAGDPIAYTIDLANTGNLTATGTLVTDTLPAEVSFVTYTASLPGSFLGPDAQTLVWNLGDVAPGASGLITVHGVISTGLGGGTLFTNTVTASTTATETVTANNTAAAPTLIGAPDLVVVKEGPASVNSGDQVAYTLTYTNIGSLNTTGVVLVDQLPAALTYVTDSLGAGVQVGNTITWTLGNLAVGASGSVVLTATTGAAGDQVNVATISSASPESDLLNNVSVFTTTVLGADPFVTKTGPAVVFGGELISYTIVYGNHGTTAAEVTLTDTLPISFTTADIAYDNSGLIAIDDTSTRSWTATLAAGDRFTFTLALTVPTSIANSTRITNTIEIATSGLGNNPIDDLSSASSTVYQIVPISTARAGTNGQVFGVEGQVIYAPNTFGTNEWGVQDASGGIAVFYSPAPVVALGDRVRLVATRGAFSGQAQLGSTVYYFANLGPGTPVQPVPFTTGQVAAGATEGWLSVVTGTVSGLPVCTPGAANYQFNLNDGSGATVIFIDKDTLVDVCALGVVNGDPLVVTGFSTQFNGLMEIKPRFPADVKRIYQITFVYRDLEDVVQAGEDVEVRGDFNSWGGAVMAHDAGYTVFSLTVTLPTTATQGYKYFVTGLSGNAGWDMLNTNNRSVSPVGGATLQNDYRNVTIGWGNLNGPAAQTINLGSPTASIDGQLYVQEVTNPAGPGRGLKAELGYGNTADPASWSWSAMAFAAQTGNNDVYAGVITPTASGVYSYATRYNGNWGVGNPNSLWVYADLDGIPFSLDQTGVLTVTAPQLDINKAVETANPEVELGEVVTYTFTLSNTGDGAATGVLITDVLPAGVDFGGFVQQNGAAYGSGVITWSGTLNAGASATVIFTATVKNDRTLHGTDILNTVQFTADNGGSGSDSAAFAVVKRYFIYMSLIQR
jgi:uncharacterized repeat protein (TIGR01451 family)